MVEPHRKQRRQDVAGTAKVWIAKGHRTLLVTSALFPVTDVRRTGRHVHFVPISDVLISTFNNIVTRCALKEKCYGGFKQKPCFR